MLSIYKPSEERSYKPSEEHRWISAILSEFLSPEWGRELNDGERAYVKRQLKKCLSCFFDATIGARLIDNNQRHQFT